MAMSKLQSQVDRMAILKYGRNNVYSDKFYSWLRNIKTDDSMQLDVFIPSQLLAIEVNGLQHRERVDFFSKKQVYDKTGKKQIITDGENALNELRFRDWQKKLICNWMNIELITIENESELDNLCNNLSNRKLISLNNNDYVNFITKSLCTRYVIFSQLYDDIIGKKLYYNNNDLCNYFIAKRYNSDIMIMNYMENKNIVSEYINGLSAEKIIELMVAKFDYYNHDYYSLDRNVFKNLRKTGYKLCIHEY